MDPPVEVVHSDRHRRAGVRSSGDPEVLDHRSVADPMPLVGILDRLEYRSVLADSSVRCQRDRHLAMDPDTQCSVDHSKWNEWTPAFEGTTHTLVTQSIGSLN